ncbi:5'-3' exoribonuclease 2-like [Haliotis rubra]|uniref:5'-3' exoribonuclease 2-like n=1 Tax=Haliotis rubra TaxID=36100 RepID=UPI001EE58739|nr:5'-3' exoribonuclease 2-like [Haliotis rubra]
MGVPAFFRWLSRKYASIVVHCVEEKPKEVNGVNVPVDGSKPNPNDIEFDNLYLDMNGIIHPCCHPEDKPAPKNEDEMMVLIFEYIDRIFSIVRPRKVLYMAIDGVAPRAKMNQQRSRRFRASKEAIEKTETIAQLREEIFSKGFSLPPEKPAQEKFDSNCITPGTPFMFKLADCLRYYIHDRLNHDSGWNGIKVILSDANVPGEGEHKIMDYIRRQRAMPSHDPNTHHCLCGADADLIMLGLATHEPYFTIIREEFKPNKPKPCELCGQMGHEMKECAGLPKEKSGEHDEIQPFVGAEQEFIFLRLNILREYLERELKMDGLPFEYDFERALDDWVFMCFFVGNDFLPHLPSLEIREGAIDRLIKLYKITVYKTGGYLTDSGVVSLERVQLVMADLGQVEDEIFKKRRETEVMMLSMLLDSGILISRRRNKEKKMRMKNQRQGDRPRWMAGGQFAPKPIGEGASPVSNPRQEAYQMRMQQTASYSTSSGGSANRNAAHDLKQSMAENGGESRGTKLGALAVEEEEEEEPDDEVKLWEDGWKDRYYKSKFDTDANDIDFRHKVAHHYVRGLCWVLRYYYQGCASWKWYFPYHYAPFASDFVNIGDLPNDFERNTEPFQPLEQLMSVFPAGSKQHLPLTWQTLMEEPESPIIDFYPTDFKIDLNGKKYAWQGVALLPFVDEKRLKEALKSVYPDLTAAERKRNVRGDDRLMFVKATEPVDLDAGLSEGVSGKIWCDDLAVLTGGVVQSILPALKDVEDNRAIGVHFKDPKFDADHLFPAKVLPGANMPAKVLKPEDFEKMFRSQQERGRGRGRDGRGGYGGRGGMGWRPQLGFTPDSGYRQDKDISSALRMIRHGSQGYGGGQNYVMSSQNMHHSQYHAGRNYGGGGSQYGSYSTGASGGGGRSGGGGGGGQGWQRNMDRYGGGQGSRQMGGYSSSYGGGSSQGYSGGYGSGYGGGYGGSSGGSSAGDSSYGGQSREYGGQRTSQSGQDRYRPYNQQQQQQQSQGRSSGNYRRY